MGQTINCVVSVLGFLVFNLSLSLSNCIYPKR